MAASVEAPERITFGQKLAMIGVVFQSIGYFIYGLFFIRLRKGFTLSTASSFFVRNLFNHSSDAQLQWFLPTTDKTYASFARWAKFKPDTVTFPDGSMGHWMGRRDAPQTILYLHGGGYMVPATLAHMKWLWDTRKELTKAGNETSVLILTYTLSPHGQFPVQLRQAINLLKYAVEEEKLSPSQIIIGGDSAGGNLTLSVLSHLMHPRSDVQEYKLTEPFRGTMLISPWIAFAYDKPDPNKYNYDMLSPDPLGQTARVFVGSAPKDNYNEPVDAPASWWATIGQFTRAVYVYCGGDEMLRPSIEKISQSISESVDLTLNIVPGATHVSTIVDNVVPFTKGVDQATLDWLKSRKPLA